MQYQMNEFFCNDSSKLEDRFGMAVSVNSVKEEAATGAALFSAYSIGMIKYKDGFGDYIKYAQKEDEK